MTARRPAVDGKRLLAGIDGFAAIGATPGGGVDRQALTVGDRAARALLAERGLARGFTVTQDAMANLFVCRAGSDEGRPAVTIGSHLDSQPTGGRFDGALGVLSAFEVLEALEDAGTTTRAPVEVVAWTNEEGSRFSPGAMGSQAYAQGAIPETWSALKGRDGASFAGELQATLDALPQAGRRALGAPLGPYVELHIEQGPVLEREGLAIGAVSGIQGTCWLEVTLTGRAAHAGTTPLAFRHDPMVAVVSMLKALQDGVMPGDADARLTVGRIEALPGSVNAIPHTVRFSLDIRHPEAETLSRLEALVRRLADDASSAAGCRAQVVQTLDMKPQAFAEPLIRAIEDAATATGHASRRILSGAFHDALYVARIAPSAMLFVPCRDGLSHNEAEFVEPQHCIAGAEVLLEVVLRLAGAEA